MISKRDVVARDENSLHPFGLFKKSFFNFFKEILIHPFRIIVTKGRVKKM
jgi:hypothetical protein